MNKKTKMSCEYCEGFIQASDYLKGLYLSGMRCNCGGRVRITGEQNE